MSEHKAFCPSCKKEVVFVEAGGKSTCPSCGFAYELATPLSEMQPPREGMTFARLLLRTALILVAVGFVGLAVAFAGCLFAFRKL